MNRRVLALAIVVVWLGTLGVLARRELWRPRAQLLAEAALTLPPGATYYTVTLDGAPVGYASTTVDTLPDTLRVADVMAVEMPVLGEVLRTEARTDVTLTRGLRLRSFTATVRGSDTRFLARGRVDGDSLLVLELTGADETAPETRRLPLTEPLVLPQLLPINVALGGELQPGRTFETRVFDPVLLASRTVAVRVVAESTFVVSDSAVFDAAADRFVPVTYDTVRAWELAQSGQGPPVRLWVDDDGLPVVMTSAMGLRMERSAFEIAYENFRRSGGTTVAAVGDDLIRRTAVGAGVVLSPGGLERLRVRLGGQALTGFDLDGDRQRLTGDTLTITREASAALRPAYRLPLRRPELAPYLLPEPLIQSDDPRIEAQARQIVGRTRRPGAVAEALTRWVHDNLRKEVTASVPSAIDVLTARRGDCNEHTTLYVALARALGLPARVAAGLVYLDGAFYYHAWPEVYLDGWVAVDPTFGQFPADAAHIRLTVGGLARQLELARVVGRLTVDVLPGPGA